MRRLAIVGDSHIAALKRGFDSAPAVATNTQVLFHPLGEGGQAAHDFYSVSSDARTVTTHVDGWRNIAFTADSFRGESGEPALIALSLPLNTSRVLRQVGWHSHVPWQLVHAQEEIPLSDQVVDAFLEQDFRHALGFAKALAGLGLPLVVIEAPRFFAHAPYLVRNRFDVCKHIDDRYRRTVRKALSTAGIPVIQQPPATVTPEGTTDSHYRHEDPSDTHHANAEYGRLALHAILTHAASDHGAGGAE